LTVSVPFMPPAAWPGTVQRNVYVPGFSVAVTDLVPPVKTGVAATFWPLGVSIVKSCASGASLVKANVSEPALAVRLVVLNLSCPVGSVEIGTV